MKSYEMVETLSEKTKVSLSKAKEALEKSNWDMLDAAIYIEKQKAENKASLNQSTSNGYVTSQQNEQNGQYSSPNYTHFSGAPNNQPFDNTQTTFGGQPYNQYGNGNANYNVPPYNHPPVSVGEMFGRFCGKAENTVNKGFRDSFVVRKNGRRIFRIPLLIFLIALLCGVFPVVMVLIIGLFLGCQYSFEGKSVGKEPLNNFFNNAKNAADKMKTDFQEGRESMKEEYDVLKNDFQKGRNETKQ